eukprot:8949706-Pyramimonas_sp.AAC.1
METTPWNTGDYALVESTRTTSGGAPIGGEWGNILPPKGAIGRTAARTPRGAAGGAPIGGEGGREQDGSCPA